MTTGVVITVLVAIVALVALGVLWDSWYSGPETSPGDITELAGERRSD